MPSWASEITSFTPRRPRRASLRRKAVQKVSASEGPTSMPSTSRRPSVLTPTATITRHRDDPAVLAHLHVGRVDPQVGPVALDRPVEEGLHPLVDLSAEAAHLALRDAAHPHGLDQVVHGAGRDALDVGLLDHGGQSLLGHPPRLQEAREVAAPCAASGCAARPCRPASPSPDHGSRCAARRARRSSRRSRRRSARRPRAPSAARRQTRSKSRAGYRRQGSSPRARAGPSSRRSSVVLGSGWSSQTRPYLKTVDDHPAKPSVRYSAMEGARPDGSAPVELHHKRGHDRARLASGPAVRLSMPDGIGVSLPDPVAGPGTGATHVRPGSAKGASAPDYS